VGDAAHVTPPFAGQGLVSGLRDAANLCWKLAWVIRGQASERILDSYDEERRPHALAMIKLAKDMGAMIMPTSVPKAVLIQGFMKSLRLIPPVRRFLEDFGPKPKNQFPKGLFVAGKSPLRRGSVIPQFKVGTRYSDDILGPGLALVGFGFDPGERLNPRLRAAWAKAGGATAMLPASDPALPKLPPDWCAVFRPDRVLLHDGPARHSEFIVHESLMLLGATLEQHTE
jgi:3-(3-hydroxy-phenyl)propionate hydroxylase